jgi:kumamolisin
MAQAHAGLKGHKRRRADGAARVGDVDRDAPVELTLTLRTAPLPDATDPIPRAELERKYGARPEDVKKVKRVLKRFGLSVGSKPSPAGSVIVNGTAAQVQKAFQTSLGLYQTDNGIVRGREGKVKVPADLHRIVTGVFGLDQRRVARRLVTDAAAPPRSPAVRMGRALGPAALEKRYSFPPGEASGQTVAIAEFGGGYFPDDVRTFCDKHRRALPDIRIVPIGAEPMTPEQITRLPADQQAQPLGESREVMMDVEIVAGLCGKARIDVLFAPFDQKGWIDLLDAVLAMDPAPVALCISWGLAEDGSDWSRAARQEINHRLHHASLLGITVCAAAGDDGAGDQVQDGRAHVHFPASSPFVLSVGGTMLEGAEEVVWWNAPGDRSVRGGGSTGGGVSVEFERPAWQNVRVRSLNADSIDGRTVPDVAALAGPPGYSLVFAGKTMRNGGTSAATPLWTALIARIAAQSDGSSPAFLAPRLYQPGPGRRLRGRSAFADVTKGDNRSPQPGRGYRARQGYDAVAGWGVPNGQALLASLKDGAGSGSGEERGTGE